ncbi:threonine/serine exporter family protein [Bacillus massilinigeriensis]|uniref:threonine/serine exporter family protein n=1 Tax=Bacillus mediterraneensis TaxID=1805474 RepID=UPI0008F87911|nr:threonine/serine exporter family protein [Bacillus mediterraneensis]
MDNQKQLYDIMDACLLAGKVMLQSGAETFRVEDTMVRMASALGAGETYSYVTPTVIMFSASGRGEATTRLIRISARTTDLKKVAMVNSVSRKISTGELNLSDAWIELKEIEAARLTYSLFYQVFAAAIASGCFTVMFKGSWMDFLPSVAAGGAGFFSAIYLHRFVPIKFFSEFLASAMIGLISFAFIKSGLGQELDKIIIGSVMPLVPGLLITNAVRDLMAGHLVSGISKGAEAFLTAFAIGSGIAVVLSLL